MTEKPLYGVVLFRSINHALMAEKILQTAGIAFKLIPVPKLISSDCGICLRFETALQEKIVQALSGKVEIADIRLLE